MADIFVSYARADREAIRTLAAQLAQHGWSVWWDRHILAGKDFDDVLQRELDNARCVVVAWSSHSIASRWVKAEAGEGLRREILVPIQLDAALPPLNFRNIQTVAFAGSPLVAQTPAFDDLIEALTALLGAPTPAHPVLPQAAPPSPPQVAPAPPAPHQPAIAPPEVREALATPAGDWITRSRLGWAFALMLAAVAAGYFLLPFLGGGRDRARESTPEPRTSIPSQVRQPPPPASLPAAAPQAAGPSDVAIRGFVDKLMLAAASGDAQRLLPFYADRVDYYTMGTVGPDVIHRDKQAYYQRWPEIKLQLEGDIVVSDGGNRSVRTVTYRSTYDLNSPVRNVRATGTATTILNVALIDGQLKIVGHQERVSAARR